MRTGPAAVAAAVAVAAAAAKRMWRLVSWVVARVASKLTSRHHLRRPAWTDRDAVLAPFGTTCPAVLLPRFINAAIGGPDNAVLQARPMSPVARRAQ